MRWLVAVLVGALLAVLAGQARAAASRVALVRQGDPPPEIAEASTRVTAELQAAGFEVVTFAARGSDAQAQVAGAQLAPPPFAIIALVPTEHGAAADVWIDRSLAGDGEKRRVEVEDASGGTASALAVRAMELLRAALLAETGKPRPQPAPLPEDVARWLASLGAPPPKPATPGPPSAPVPLQPGAAAAPRARTPLPAAASSDTMPPLLSAWSLEGGAAWLHGFGGFGAAFGPTLRLTAPILPSTALRVSVLAPAITREVELDGVGASALRQELAFVEVTRALAGGRLVPLLSLGAGGYHLFAEGRATGAGYTASDVHAWAFALGGGAGAALRIAPRVALLLDGRAVVLLKAPQVKFDQQDVAGTGTPMMLLSLGVHASL